MQAPGRKGGDACKGKGYMGMSSGESEKFVEEISGCTRGERFQEKRQRIGEGPAMIEVRYCEEQPHETKQPFNDDKEY